MNPAAKTSKPVDTLTSMDIETFTIWESPAEIQGGGDEPWIRPLERSTIPLDARALSVVADFVAADGTPFAGIVGLSTEQGIAIESAALLAGGIYVYAAHGEKTPLRYKTRTASELGKAPANIYPLRFTLRAKLDGEAAARSGIFA